jgi:hypothetical protein
VSLGYHSPGRVWPRDGVRLPYPPVGPRKRRSRGPWLARPQRAAVTGPYAAVAADIFLAGGTIGDVYLAGSAKSQLYLAGAVIGQAEPHN